MKKLLLLTSITFALANAQPVNTEILSKRALTIVAHIESPQFFASLNRVLMAAKPRIAMLANRFLNVNKFTKEHLQIMQDAIREIKELLQSNDTEELANLFVNLSAVAPLRGGVMREMEDLPEYTALNSWMKVKGHKIEEKMRFWSANWEPVYQQISKTMQNKDNRTALMGASMAFVTGITKIISETAPELLALRQEITALAAEINDMQLAQQALTTAIKKLKASQERLIKDAIALGRQVCDMLDEIVAQAKARA